MSYKLASIAAAALYVTLCTCIFATRANRLPNSQVID
jgi:hypothetical protein